MAEDNPHDEFMDDIREKQLLLQRFKLYFPHEPEKNFDVSLESSLT